VAWSDERAIYSMSLTYDQMSALSMAFQEAHVPSDRRQSQRIKQRIAAEITEWENNKPGRTFGVTIEDFSPTGVGLVHSGRLKLGATYTLEIPRPGRPPIRIVLSVVRCDQLDAGMFSTRMEASEILAGREAKSESTPLTRIMLVGAAIAFVATLAVYFTWLQ
jgi:c-di-GMP-binding flagellar brake protein YcgR